MKTAQNIIKVATALLVLAAFGNLFAAEVPAKADKAPPAAPEGYSFLTSDEEKRGDYEALAKLWARRLADHPNSPEAWMMLKRLPFLSPKVEHPLGPKDTLLVPLLEKLLRGEGKVRLKEPANEHLVRLALANAMRSSGRDDEADKLERQCGYVPDWFYLGPFGVTRSASFYREFSPESGVDLDAEFPVERWLGGGAPRVRWTLMEQAGSGRNVDLFDRVKSRGCMYGLAYVRCQQPTEAYVVVRAECFFLLCVNGRTAVRIANPKSYVPVVAAAKVLLGEGWTEFLAKQPAATSSFSIRLLDVSGRPLRGVSFATDLEVIKKAKLADTAVLPAGDSPAPTGETVFGGFYRKESEEARRAGRAGEQGAADIRKAALARAASAMCFYYAGAVEEALKEMRGANAEYPCPALDCHLAWMTERAWLVPWSRARNTKRTLLERAGGKGWVGAKMRLAHLFAKEQKHDKAIAELKDALKVNPHSAPVLFVMAATALQKQWLNECRTWLSDAERLAPDSKSLHRLWASYYEILGNEARALEELRVVREADLSNFGILNSLVDRLKLAGKTAEAIKLLERECERTPLRKSPFLSLAGLLAESGTPDKLDKTLEWMERARALFPLDATFPKLKGDVLWRAGRKEAALDAYDEALAIRPSWHAVRRLTQHLRGESDDFRAEFAVDVRKAIAESQKKEFDPRIEAGRVIDQTVLRVLPDGGVVELTHEAERVLNISGVERCKKQHSMGEFIEARTHKADWTVLEPTILSQDGAFTMPGVEVGSTVEYRFRAERGPIQDARVHLSPWFFRSPELDKPFEFTEYIIIVPDDDRFVVSNRNWHVGALKDSLLSDGSRLDETSLPETVPEKRGTLRVYRWAFHDVPQIDREAGMDHISTILPFIEAGVAWEWESLTEYLSQSHVGDTSLTDELRQTARRVVEEAGATTAGEKARALYSFVNEIIKTRSGLQTAAHVLAERSGDRKSLLIALMRAAGVDARLAHLRLSSQASDPQSPSSYVADWRLRRPEFFNEECVCWFDDLNRPKWLDCSSRFNPFGALQKEYQGAFAVVLSPVSETDEGVGGLEYELHRLPVLDSMANGLALSLEVALRPDGSAECTGARRIFGTRGAVYKEYFSTIDSGRRRDWVQTDLSSAFPGSKLKEYEMLELPRTGKPFELRWSFGIEECVSTVGGESSVHLPLPRLNMSRVFVSSVGRLRPRKIWRPLGRRDTVRVRCGPGIRIGRLPENVALRHSFGSYSLSFARTEDGLKMVRVVDVPVGSVPPEEHEDLIAFCRAVDQAEDERIAVSILARGEAGAGGDEAAGAR